MKTLFTGLSPNAEADDVLLALKLLLMPWKWRRGGARGVLEGKIRDLLGVSQVFAFESGRTSLMVGLSSLGLSEGDEVLLQAYTCVAVPNAVRWAGGTPVYVDCDPHTLTMDLVVFEKKITPQSRVVILQHTFGNPGDLLELLRIAKKYHLVIIEDCAHTIGGEYKEKKLGTYGDMAIFSFGRDKALSSVFGGALVSNNAALSEKIRVRYDTAPSSQLPWIAKQLLHPLICWLIVRIFSFGLGKIILFLAKKFHILSLAVLPEERTGERPSFIGKKMPNALAEAALHQFSKLDRYNAHRLHMAKKFIKALASFTTNYQLPTTNSWIPLRYTIQVEHPDELLRSAKAEGIYLGDWYRQAIAPNGVSYDTIGYVPGSCLNAEKASQHSVNLPLDIHITNTDADRIIRCIQSYYDREGS